MKKPELLVPLIALTLLGGCAGRLKPAEMAALDLPAAGAPAQPPALVEDLFAGDRSARISDRDLLRVLAAPVFLESGARVGVVRVRDRYAIDDAVPTAEVTGRLQQAVEETGLFDVVTEVASDWPSDRGLPGLRELAARYRAEYLLLYRHRFVGQAHTNAWATAWLTLVGALFVPATTLESDGLLEATLFDVKSGTILFTVFERTRGSAEVNPWQNERKRRRLERELVQAAATRLGDQVVAKTHRLAAARPADLGVQPAIAPLGPAPAPSASPVEGGGLRFTSDAR